MENESINATKGAEVTEKDTELIQQAEVSSLDKVAEDKTTSGKGLGDIRLWAGLYKGMVENLQFTVLLVAVIGYIVVASFGEMKTIDQFLRYIVFLTIAFFLYKFVGLKDLNFKVDISKRSWFFIVTYLSLIALVITKYFSYIRSFLGFVLKILSPTPGSLGQ
ncbi:MAG TPA: hypothetical protein VMX76_02825 [Nevskiaceae bacterium]|nr:hypothetical protein [Nevskiaceae bacterium]